MNVSALGNVWYPAIMNSAEETNDVVNLARQHFVDRFVCGNGAYGIGGSTNDISNFGFGFSRYIQNTSGL